MATQNGDGGGGRKDVDKPNVANDVKNPKKNSSKKRRHEGDGHDDRADNSMDSSAKKRKGKKDVDDMAWICGECNEAECMLEPTADFLLCDGTCFRVFHHPCVGISSLPDSDDDWLCKDCTARRHQCAFCHEYGIDKVEVFPCRRQRCGLYFHESCLAVNNVEVFNTSTAVVAAAVATAVTTTTTTTTNKENPANGTTSSNEFIDESKSDSGDPNEPSSTTETTTAPTFTCPAHTCWTCTQKDLQREEQQIENEKSLNGPKKKGKKKKKHQSIYQCKTETRLFRCLYCPWAFHASCIPPTSRFHELAVLCPEHSATHKLPELDLSTSFQGTVEDQIDQQMLKISGKKKSRSGNKRSGANPFFPGMRGDRLESQEKFLFEFLANSKNKNDEEDGDTAEGKVNEAVKLNEELSFCLPCDVKNEVHSKPPSYRFIHSLKYDPNNKPKKIPPAGEMCACIGSCGDDCYNRISAIECYGDNNKSSNCHVGENCGNRSLGKRQFVKCKPKREGGRGWGLITLEKIPKGKLVQEYVGEVIDEKTMEKRLHEWNKEHPNDPNFYVMALSGGWYIDARECANMTRFINHSCDPNCMLSTINVKGFKRNGIFSKRDIEAGEFLSYDYQFDTKQGDRFVCRCGAKNCRGTMKGKNNGITGVKKPGSWKEAKARYEQDKKFVEERRAQQVKSQVSAMIPAAEQPDEYVMVGPPEKHRESVIRNRILLWRNAKMGADFVSRNSRLEATTKRYESQINQTRKSGEITDVLSLVRKHNNSDSSHKDD